MSTVSLTEIDRRLGPLDFAICPATPNVGVSQRTITKTAVVSESREFKLHCKYFKL
jgi:hypothetical protein